jgi:hypothetical protein
VVWQVQSLPLHDWTSRKLGIVGAPIVQGMHVASMAGAGVVVSEGVTERARITIAGLLIRSAVLLQDIGRLRPGYGTKAEHVSDAIIAQLAAAGIGLYDMRTHEPLDRERFAAAIRSQLDPEGGE